MELMQLPGIGVIVSMTVLSAIGAIARFESANKLVGYSGLGAGVHDSGKEHIEKRITKSGRRELRWALVEAAWRAIRISPYWKEQYEKYLRRMRRPNQAIVVIAGCNAKVSVTFGKSGTTVKVVEKTAILRPLRVFVPLPYHNLLFLDIFYREFCVIPRPYGYGAKVSVIFP